MPLCFVDLKARCRETATDDTSNSEGCEAGARARQARDFPEKVRRPHFGVAGGGKPIKKPGVNLACEVRKGRECLICQQGQVYIVVQMKKMRSPCRARVTCKKLRTQVRKIGPFFKRAFKVVA